jgi:hypothetical protein
MRGGMRQMVTAGDNLIRRLQASLLEFSAAGVNIMSVTQFWGN